MSGGHDPSFILKIVSVPQVPPNKETIAKMHENSKKKFQKLLDFYFLP